MRAGGWRAESVGCWAWHRTPGWEWSRLPEVPHIIFPPKYNLGARLVAANRNRFPEIFREHSLPPGRWMDNLSALPGNNQVWERGREGAPGCDAEMQADAGLISDVEMNFINQVWDQLIGQLLSGYDRVCVTLRLSYITLSDNVRSGTTSISH